jgi:hypothetical protein
MIHDAADIDTILVAAKRIAGQPAWLRGSGAKGERSEIASFRAQLEVDGIIRTDVAIAGNAHVFLPVQPVTLVLICGQRPVERLDLSPRTSHVNPVRAGLPAELSGLVLQPGVHHLHPWRLNREWPPQGNLPAAQPWPALDTIAGAIQSFLGRLNIAGTLPPPPHEPRLVP